MPAAKTATDQPEHSRYELRVRGPIGPTMMRTRLFVFARHAESTANVARIVSSNPAHLVWLTAKGKLQARQLGMQLAGIDIDLAVATRLQRTQQTAQLALEGRNVPLLIEPGLDEIDSGNLDRAPIEAYWDWEQHHGPSERFPHGETENEALLRYRSSLERLLSRAEPVTLVVLHEFALRRIVWVAAGFPLPPDEGFGNAVPYFLGEHAVGRAAAGLASMARSPRPGLKTRAARTAVNRSKRSGRDLGSDRLQSHLQRPRSAARGRARGTS